MIKFKDFIENNLAFSNSGGTVNQYDHYNFTNHQPFSNSGGPVDDGIIEENLNPRHRPIIFNSDKEIFHDPENPNINIDKLKKLLHENTDHKNNLYKEYMNHYTFRSDNLNSTLWNNYRNKLTTPNELKSHNIPSNKEPIINLNKFDSLIHSHKAPENITVYSGLHYHPSEYRGKVMFNPAYLSTSISPHVSKDFGIAYNSFYDNEEVPIKSIVKFTIPKGHPMLYTGSGSHSPEQHEIILPRGVKYQLGQLPTHVINGKFKAHHNDKITRMQIHLWQARILPSKR